MRTAAHSRLRKQTRSLSILGLAYECAGQLKSRCKVVTYFCSILCGGAVQEAADEVIAGIIVTSVECVAGIIATGLKTRAERALQYVWATKSGQW